MHKITILGLIFQRVTCSFTFRQRKYLRVLRMSQNNTKVRIFGTKKEELKGKQQKLHASGLRNF